MSRTSLLILSSLFKTPKTMDTWDISKCERTEDNEPFHSVTATTFWFVFCLHVRISHVHDWSLYPKHSRPVFGVHGFQSFLVTAELEYDIPPTGA